MADDKEKADERSGEKEPFFSVPYEANPTASYSGSAEGPGTQVGPYKLLGILGEGGFGVVYLAEEREPIKRRVALKIIKPGMDSKEVLARFGAERQTLALLDHPNIAHIFGAGMTKTGRPYFAMEYVKGLSINEHCDQHKLNIKERLELFQQVCRAVQHAHQKGIIHRDIKPSNILVSVEDDQRLPKVIDFGVAKAMGQTLTEQTLYTQAGQVVGTPEYMSPEQAQMSPEGIDTCSDIYSLGAVLYELLIGVLPFDPERLRRGGVDAIRRMICEEEPKTPSTRLTGLGEAGSTVARQRQTDVVSLVRCLHRELEWIPLMAMRKDRERRYQSAAEFADDIQNYLEGAPLIAGPESVAYKIRKFVQRHAGAVAAATAIVVLLIVGLLVSTILYVQAKQAGRIAEERSESYRRSLYGNRIALAESAYRDGHRRRVSDLLTSCPADLRDWEWDWLSYISDESDSTLGGWPKYRAIKEIMSIVLSPDGKRVFVAGVKGGIQVWDLESGSDIMAFRVGDWIWSVDLDPLGKRLVTGTMGGAIQLWDAITGEELMTLQERYGEPYTGDTHEVCSVAFSQDGKRIVSGGRTVKLWDAATGQELMIFEGHADKVWEVAFSPDGRRIASGSFDKTVKIWDAETGDELMTLRGHTDEVYSVAFSTDGKRIASGSRTIKVWNAETGENILTIYGPEDNFMQAVSFSPDGQQIVSGGSARTVILWDAESGAEITTLRGHSALVSSVAFSPDGRRVISGSYDTTIKVWNPSVDLERTILYGHKASVRSISFTPDGKRLISGSHDGTIKMWDVASACELMTLYGHKGKVRYVSSSPDGKRIVSASADTHVKLWDATTGSEVMTLSGHVSSVNCVVFSPDGKKIMSGSDDKTIKVWDAATGKELRTLTGHQAGVSSIGFSPAGDRVASTSWDGYAKIWDAISSAELASIRVHEGAPTCVVFMPDGRHIVTGGGYHGGDVGGREAKIWDVYSKEEVMTLQCLDNVTSVALTPGCRRILTASQDKVKLWDAVSAAEILELRTNGNKVWSTAVSPDGKTIASSNDNGDIVLLESTAPAGGYEPRINAESARKFVDRLHTECGSYKKVLEKIEADTTLDNPVRQFGFQIARSRLGEDSRKTEE